MKLLLRYEVKSIKSSALYNLSPTRLAGMIEGFDVIVNLAGASIFARWTNARKRKIHDSRILTTRKIVEALAVCKNPPHHLINASAVGIYASNETHDESSDRFSNNFLAKVVQEWEDEANNAKKLDIKVSLLRFGVVLGKDGGAYQKMRTLTKYNLGTYFGKGNQLLPYVFLNDLLNAILFIIENNIEGVVNITSPTTSTYKEFVYALKKKLSVRIIWSVPQWLIKIVLGEASLLFLEGQNVIPSVLTENNFNFEAGNINQCVELIEAN